MEAEKRWVFISIIVIFAVAVTVYFGTVTSPAAELNVTAYPQPAKIGFVTIKVVSSLPLAQVFAILPDRVAEFDRQEGDEYYFNYFVSPYDEIGLKPILITAVDVNGHEITDESQSLYVGYNAAGDKINDVIFYSYNWQPVLKATELIASDSLLFFFEVRPYEDDGDKELINAFIPLITELASNGINLTSYELQFQGDEWISCMNTEAVVLPVENCSAILKANNSIFLRYPRYPTSQVLVTNTTVEIQPKFGEVQTAVNAVIDLVGFSAPEFVFTPNSTVIPNNSSPNLD